MSDKPDHKTDKPVLQKPLKRDGESGSADTLVEMAIIPFFIDGDETGEHSNVSTPTIAEMIAEDPEDDEADFDDGDDTIRIEVIDDEEQD